MTYKIGKGFNNLLLYIFRPYKGVISLIDAERAYRDWLINKVNDRVEVLEDDLEV